MIKFFKKIFVFATFVLFLPLCVKAADYGLTFTCQKSDGTECPKQGTSYAIPKGEKVKLIFDVTGEGVSGFESNVSLQAATGPSNFEYNESFWNLTQEGGFLNNKIILAGSNNSGEPKFSFDITAGDAVYAFVTFSSIDISDSDGNDHPLQNNIIYSFYIVSEDSGNSGSGASSDTDNNNSGDTNTNGNANDNTNNNTNTNGDTKDSSDSNKSKTDNPVNPKTGVKVSIFGIIVMGIGCVSYLVLRKKNYFNKI